MDFNKLAQILGAGVFGLTVSNAAIAEEYQALADVEGWTITRGIEQGGCMMQKVNADGYLVRIGKTAAGHDFGRLGVYTSDKDAYVLEGEAKDVTFDLDGERFFGKATMEAAAGGYRGGYAEADNPAFGEALARKYVLTINPDGKSPVVIDLKGTFKAMEAVRECDVVSRVVLTIQESSKYWVLSVDAVESWLDLMAVNPHAAALAKDAKAVLIFPEITKAGLGIGASGGKGVMLTRERHLGYYKTTSITVGAQAGVQTYGYVVMFLTDAALEKFTSKKGYKLGVDGSFVVIDAGATAEFDTTTLKADTVGFVFDEKGLMLNLVLEGSRIKELK